MADTLWSTYLYMITVALEAKADQNQTQLAPWLRDAVKLARKQRKLDPRYKTYEKRLKALFPPAKIDELKHDHAYAE